MNRILLLAAFLWAGSLFLKNDLLEASTVLALNLEQMTNRADTIFTGRVVNQRADWNADHTRIYTFITFEVEHYLKGGNSARKTTVRLLGGRVGPVIAHLPGTPKFIEGEEVLLFCAGREARIPSVLGLSLGKFTITTDALRRRVVKRDISTLLLANHNTQLKSLGSPVRRYQLTDIANLIESYQQ